VKKLIKKGWEWATAYFFQKYAARAVRTSVLGLTPPPPSTSATPPVDATPTVAVVAPSSDPTPLQDVDVKEQEEPTPPPPHQPPTPPTAPPSASWGGWFRNTLRYLVYIVWAATLAIFLVYWFSGNKTEDKSLPHQAQKEHSVTTLPAGVTYADMSSCFPLSIPEGRQEVNIEVKVEPGKWTQPFCFSAGDWVDQIPVNAVHRIKVKIQDGTEHEFFPGSKPIPGVVNQASYMAMGSVPEKIRIRLYRK
jgi:hypothetical protein